MPAADVLTDALERRTSDLDRLQTTAMVLVDQLAYAKLARQVAHGTRAVRETAADVAEVEYLMEIVQSEVDLAGDEVEYLRARLAAMNDPGAAVAELSRARTATDSHDMAHASALIAALDAEVDAGRLATHPLRQPGRDALLSALRGSLEASPDHPAAVAWREQLQVMEDPLLVRRLALRARHTGDPADRAAAERAADAAERAGAQGDRAPHLHAV